MSEALFEPAQARQLIDLLATDDAFRAQFSASPLEAMVSAGVIPASVDPKVQAVVKSCCSVGKLASKESIAAARAEIDRMLTSRSSQTVPALDANLEGGRTLK